MPKPNRRKRVEQKTARLKLSESEWVVEYTHDWHAGWYPTNRGAMKLEKAIVEMLEQFASLFDGPTTPFFSARDRTHFRIRNQWTDETIPMEMFR